MNEQMYYIQDSRDYVGNSPLWWGKNRSGYTCDIDKAGLYTEEDAMGQFNSRETDVPWKQEDVEKAVKRLVDHQYLNKNDEDGFYTRLEKLQKEKRLQLKKEREEYALKEYKDNELFSIYEQFTFGIHGNIKNSTDFEIEFDDEVKGNLDWHEHYYPTAYPKQKEEIFEDLIKYDYIFKCDDCKNYCLTLNRDEDIEKICDSCGEERWEHEQDDEG